MGDPFTDVTVLNYNDDPPADDGSQVPSNRVNWATVKTEIGDPLKTAIDSLVTNTGSAVDKLVGGAGVTATTAGYTVQASDQGKLVRVTSSGTLTTATAATVGAPFVHAVANASTGTLTIDGASSETIDGESTITLPPGAGVILFTDGTNWFTGGRGRIQGSSSFVASLPRGYLSGCQLSNNATDSDHDIDISAGVARDFSNTFNFEVSSTLTKQIDASWAEGTDAGGMATGVSLDTNTWYHVFLVETDDGGTDAGFDTNASASNLVNSTSGIASAKRRIGSVLTDASSNIIAFSQLGDEFLWLDPPESFDDSVSTTQIIRAIDVPIDVKVKALVNLSVTTTDTQPRLFYLSSPDVNDESPAGGAPGPTFGITAGGTVALGAGVRTEVRTNTSAQVRIRANASTSAAIYTLGWIDTRGRDD